MLLSISMTQQPATDLGYLLHKHPEKIQAFKLNFGQAHVFYPEAADDVCTAVLLLDINPINLVRGKMGGFALQPYVNDRPYVASSFLSVAIAKVYGSALNGRCKTHPALAQTPIPLKATITALPMRGGEQFLRSLFEPLGYVVGIEQYELDEHFPDWGQSRYVTLTLEGEVCLHELLTHLYVLIPVLDDDKHYFVSQDEVEKLLRRGEDWLADHPQREAITHRYLKRQRHLTRMALSQLMDDEANTAPDEVEEVVERKIGLHEQRLLAVTAVLKESGYSSVMDLGCGEGKLLRLLLKESQFRTILGMDISHRSLAIAFDRLRLEQMGEFQRNRINLHHSSLFYRDERLLGFEAAAVVEVIEHLDAPRLRAFERLLFGQYQPKMVVMTTPNREYNVMWPSLSAGKFRHRDHRFEWTRAEFAEWAESICEAYGYQVYYQPIGEVDEAVGAPSQMGVFVR